MAAITKSRSYSFKNDDEFKKISHESFLAFKRITKDKQPIDKQLKELERFLNEVNNK